MKPSSDSYGIKEPQAAHHGRENVTDLKLCKQEGMPAPPFKTDSP